jgi:hypothetical protein
MAMMTDPLHRLSWIFLLLLCLPLSVAAQRKDFLSWWEGSLRYDFTKDLALDVELEQRFKENSLLYDRSLLTGALRYELHKAFRVSGGARFILVTDPSGALQPRYRLNLDGTGLHELGEVRLSLRARFQYGFEEFTRFAEIRSNNLVNRYRLKADHHIFGTPLDVFASVEPWGVFGAPDGRFLKRMRYSVGVTYSLGMRSELLLRYILEDEVRQVNPLQSHIVVLGYGHRL